MSASEKKSILIIGSTGLVGGFALNELEKRDDIHKIYLPVRTIPDNGSLFPKRVYQRIQTEPGDSWFPEEKVDAVLCCVGTTMKKAKSRKAFCDVDYKIPIEIAKATKARKIPIYGVISAAGASPKSLFFYNRVKGEMEAGLRRIGLDRLLIFRPSLLTGPREELRKRERLAENFLSAFEKVIPQSFRPISAIQVAQWMVQKTFQGDSPLEIISSKRMRTPFP